MQTIHILMAVFAAWRLTELMLIDGIFQPVRTLAAKWKWTNMLMSCPRCLSVWAGGMVTAVYGMKYADGWKDWAILMATWPFALSFSYLFLNRVVEHLMPAKPDGLFLEWLPNGVRPNWGNTDPRECINRMRMFLAHLDENDRKNEEQRQQQAVAQAKTA